MIFNATVVRYHGLNGDVAGVTAVIVVTTMRCSQVSIDELGPLGHVLDEATTQSNDPVQGEFGEGRAAIVMLTHCLHQFFRVCAIRPGGQLRTDVLLGVVYEDALVGQAVNKASTMVTCETLGRLQGRLICPKPSPCSEGK